MPHYLIYKYYRIWSLILQLKQKDVLLDMIKRHNKMYRMGTPEISDAEYDAEIELLKNT